MVALSQLEEPYREILELRMIQDLKFAEIAQIVNLKDSATRTHYTRALRQLKKEYCLLRGEEI